MSTTDAARANAPALPDINDVQTLLCRIRNLNELMFMAGESMSDRVTRNAITTGADVIDDMLKQADDMIDAIRTAGREGGAK